MTDKDRIRKIETAISAIVGDGNKSKWWENHSLRKRVESLMLKRCVVLNRMFVPDDANLERIRDVNDRLYGLTVQLHARVSKMANQLPSIMCDSEFDTDYILEGTLNFSFNGDHSVLKFNDDTYYGSDFTVMIDTLDYLMSSSGIPYIESFIPGQNIPDDGISWAESPFGGSEYEGIIICHAVHVLCNHNLFSIPDLIRLNDFRAEVNVTVQKIDNKE